MISPK